MNDKSLSRHKIKLSKINKLGFVFNCYGKIIWSNNQRTFNRRLLQKCFELRFIDKVKMQLYKCFEIKLKKFKQSFTVRLLDKNKEYYIAVAKDCKNIENIIMQMDFLIDHEEVFYLLNFNIDKFRQINQTKGYDFGNRILNDFERKIKKYFDSESIYNLYCDQFIVITHDIKKNIEVKLDQLLQNDTLIYQGFNYSASVGLIDHPLDYRDSEKLLLGSEKALTIAKEKYFSNKKYCDYHKKTLEDHVYSFFSHQHIDPEEFYMCYQSILSISGETIGYEALLRWKNKKIGLVNPDIFIPIAEKLGCITKITEMVFEKVLRDIRENDVLFDSKFVTINISIDDLKDPEFNRKLKAMKKDYPKIITKIIFEITESLEFEKSTTLNRILKQIHRYGIHVFIDDFGTGFSSLDRIMNTSIDGIKIDRSFTSNLLKKENHRIMLESMIFMANRSNIVIVIEGVETKEEHEYLRSLDTCLLQGYYFSKPSPLETIQIPINSKAY